MVRLMEPAARGGFMRSLFVDSLVVASGGAAVKGAGLLKLALAAHFFGASDSQDAFFLAFLLPSILTDTIAAAVTPCLIPALAGLREQHRPAEAVSLYRECLGANAAVMCVLALIAAAIAHPAIAVLGSGFSVEKAAFSRTLLLCMLPLFPLVGLSIVWRAVLNASQRFGVAAIAPVTTPLLTAGLLFSAGSSWGVFALAAGAVAGAAIECAVLACAVHSLGYPLWPAKPGMNQAFLTLLSQFWPMLATSVLLGCMPVIDNAMTAGLEPGSVSVLAFGTKLTLVILSVGSSAVATAVLPRLSAMAARNDWQAMRVNLTTLALALLAIAVPAVLVLIALSEPLVRLVLLRGVFTEASALAVTQVQQVSLLQIPIAILTALGFKLVSSLRFNDLLIPLAAIGVAVTAIADYVLRYKLGVAGIALAASLSQLSMLFGLTLLLRRRLRVRALRR